MTNTGTATSNALRLQYYCNTPGAIVVERILILAGYSITVGIL